MIIGAILESGDGQGSGSNRQNGAALVVFYTMADAVSWAELQSTLVLYDTAPSAIYTLCSVINTDTNVKRWWYAGTEYTG